MPRDLIIINPRSNTGKAVQNINAGLQRSPKNVRRYYDNATKIILRPDQTMENPEVVAAFRKHNRIFICSGDGTINSLITSLAKHRLLHAVRIGVIPGGFGNAVAAMLGVDDTVHGLSLLKPLTPARKADLFATNVPSVPYITFCAGVGLEGEIVKTRQKTKHLSGLSYLIAGMTEVFRHKPGRFKLKIDDRSKISVLASSIMIANGPFYGLAKAAPRARIDDGLMDVRVFNQNLDFVLNLQPRHLNLYPVDNLSQMDIRAKRLRIKGKFSLQIDGDPVALEGPFETWVLPRKVNYLYLRKVDRPKKK